MTEIKSSGELEACSYRTIVTDEVGLAWQRLNRHWYQAGSDDEYDSESLFDAFAPLTLVWTPGGAA